MSIRQRTFEIIEKSQGNDLASSVFDVSLIILILLNIAAVIAASFSDFAAAHAAGLYRFEVFSIVIFTIEYALRLWTARNKYQEAKHPYLKHIFSASAVIDLLAILPFFLPFLIPVDLRFLRVIRLLRIARIFKLGRYNKARGFPRCVSITAPATGSITKIPVRNSLSCCAAGTNPPR
ncbi:MAG: ion transporter, partial [Treponema sp.]|nr:ion transporter [Treponema sp.]